MASSFTTKSYNYSTGLASSLTGTTTAHGVDGSDTQYALASCCMKPTRIYNSAGTLINYEKGLFAQLVLVNNGGDGLFQIDTWDLATGVKDALNTLHPGWRAAVGGALSSYAVYTGAAISDVCSVYCGIVSGGSNKFLAVWIADAAGANPHLIVWRNGIYDNTGATVYGAASSIPESFVVKLTDSGLITCVEPSMLSSDPFLTVCKGNTAAGKAQLVAVKAVIDSKATPTASSDTWVERLAREYTAASWTGWTDRPDTLLECETFADTSSAVAALFGNWVAPGLHKAVSNPRIAILNSVERSGFGYGWNPGEVTSSHTNGTAHKAHGLAMGPDLSVFVVGTGDIVGGTAGKLICKYNTFDLTAGPTATVAHLSNGLGDGYADPQDTHIVTPIWDGKNLIVQDHDATKTRLFVYDKDLNYVGVSTVSTTSVSTGLRLRGGRTANMAYARRY